MTHHKLFLTVLAASSLIALYGLRYSSKPNLDSRRQVPRSQSVATDSGTARQAQPAYRSLSHGVHPGSADGDETQVADLDLYTHAVGKETAFVYFSQELNKKWLEGEHEDTDPLFPKDQIKEIRRHQATPFIRLMTRSKQEENEDKNLEKLYSYDVLLGKPGLKGDDLKNSRRFHDRIVAWGTEAAKCNFPIYVEWGTEVNGKWFWWNARWYAEKECKKSRSRGESESACMDRVLPHAPDKFREVFAHLRDLINGEAKAKNVKWIFHVTASGDPKPGVNAENSWNSIAKYYPEGAVDAIGLSVYGSQERSEECAEEKHSFLNQMNQVLEGRGRPEEDTLKTIAGTTPIYILEFGETLLIEGNNDPESNCNAGKWAREALNAMFDTGKWPQYNLAGFSWWNEAWVDKKKGITDMRVHDFQLCKPKDKEVGGMRCDCWRGATEGCDNLSKKRSDLRESLKSFFEGHCKFLITSAADSCLPLK
jgi:hypothetical protein